MAQIILNSTVGILIASAFLAATLAALRSQERVLQKVPVKASRRHRPTPDYSTLKPRAVGCWMSVRREKRP